MTHAQIDCCTELDYEMVTCGSGSGLRDSSRTWFQKKTPGPDERAIRRIAVS